MIAKLWAQEIMDKESSEEAKALYARVPRLLNYKTISIKLHFNKGSCNFGCKALLCRKRKLLVEKSMRGFYG